MPKKPTMFVGIDVSKASLSVATDGDASVLEFSNDSEGHKKLVHFMKKRGPAVVALEATGTYGLDVALLLRKTRDVSVRYVNPAAAKAFSRASLGRSKTDRVDARMLARMAAVMDLPEWTPPEEHELALRSITRRVRGLINERTREHNRLSAVEATDAFHDLVSADIKEHIAQLDARVEALRGAAVAFVRKHQDLARKLDLITSIRGIADASGVEVLGELVCLPRDLTSNELVAMAGLDPRPHQSGTMDGQRRISRMGNKYLRGAMHMPAVNAARWQADVKAFFEKLTLKRNKRPMVAYVAVARKLLRAIHAMLRSDTTFQGKLFHAPQLSP